MGLPAICKFMKKYNKILHEIGVIIPFIIETKYVIVDVSGILCNFLTGFLPHNPDIDHFRLYQLILK